MKKGGEIMSKQNERERDRIEREINKEKSTYETQCLLWWHVVVKAEQQSCTSLFRTKWPRCTEESPCRRS